MVTWLIYLSGRNTVSVFVSYFEMASEPLKRAQVILLFQFFYFRGPFSDAEQSKSKTKKQTKESVDAVV